MIYYALVSVWTVRALQDEQYFLSFNFTDAFFSPDFLAE